LFSHRSETQRTARVRLASSLAAAALDSHFEHPESRFSDFTLRKATVDFEQKLSFPTACSIHH
jgi:hypothetical protein